MGIARVENEHAWQSGMWHHLPNMRALHASLQDLQAVMLTCSFWLWFAQIALACSPFTDQRQVPEALGLLPSYGFAPQSAALTLSSVFWHFLIQNIQIAESPAENVWAKMFFFRRWARTAPTSSSRKKCQLSPPGVGDILTARSSQPKARTAQPNLQFFYGWSWRILLFFDKNIILVNVF